MFNAPLLGNGLSDFSNILHDEAQMHIVKGNNCKFLKSKMADNLHFENCYITINN